MKMITSNCNGEIQATFSMAFTITTDMVVFAVAEALTNKCIDLHRPEGIQEAVTSFVEDYGLEALKAQNGHDIIDISSSFVNQKVSRAKEIVKKQTPELFKV